MRAFQGITPCGYRILIRPDTVEEEITPGGIVLGNKEQDMAQKAQASGTLMAVGPAAWADCKDTEGNQIDWAHPGDRVHFNKYEGETMVGLDGLEYRLINDTAVQAVLDPDIKIGVLAWRTPYE
jgi:co-chaperonin GroES (HSP10)